MKKVLVGLITLLLFASVACSKVDTTTLPASSITTQASTTMTSIAAAATTTPRPNTSPPQMTPLLNQMITPDYTELQITLVPGQVQRLNVFAENNDIIDYSWKSDYAPYFWFTTPKGLAMSSWDSLPCDPQPYVPQDPNKWVAGGIWWVTGLTDSIKVEGKYCSTGYYSFCFFVTPDWYEAWVKTPSPILFRYRVEKPLERSQMPNALNGLR